MKTVFLQKITNGPKASNCSSGKWSWPCRVLEHWISWIIMTLRTELRPSGHLSTTGGLGPIIRVKLKTRLYWWKRVRRSISRRGTVWFDFPEAEASPSAVFSWSLLIFTYSTSPPFSTQHLNRRMEKHKTSIFLLSLRRSYYSSHAGTHVYATYTGWVYYNALPPQ